MATQKRYNKEFKLGAARSVVEQGYTQREAEDMRELRKELVRLRMENEILKK